MSKFICIKAQPKSVIVSCGPWLAHPLIVNNIYYIVDNFVEFENKTFKLNYIGTLNMEKIGLVGDEYITEHFIPLSVWRKNQIEEILKN